LTVDLSLVASLAVGALAAAGVLIVVNELVPAPPALGASLRRLHPELPEPGGRLAAAAERLRARWPVPHESLALLDRTPEQYFTALAAGAVSGLGFPVVLAVMTASAGAGRSATLAAGGVVLGLAAAAVGAVVAHLELRSRAAGVRRRFRPVIATYLSLVAMQRAAGHGSVESLERAARIGDGPAVRLIREALRRARTHHRPPWDELQALGTRLGVAELADVGQIMRGSGLSGAQVHRTLLQRAGSLRDQIRTDALERAERTTAKLEVPGAALLFILAFYFLYALMRQIDMVGAGF
jgi:Flp pilus assembly protein TadB